MTPVARRERKKNAAREQIISKGIGLFAQRGIEATTIEQIANAADIGKGTVYNYFQSKEEIIVAFIADIERQVQEKLRGFDAFDGDVDDILSDFILFQFQLKAPHYQFVRVFLARMFGHSDQLLPYLVEMQKSIDPPIDFLFQTLGDRGLIRQDLDTPELILAFKTVHLGLTGLWAMEGPPFAQTERVLRLQMKLFSEGLKAGEAYEV
jgi:AcrR family transcriptional regulator